MPNAELVERLRAHLRDDFSRGLFEGALDALTQPNANTRIQHFSVSLRELSVYSLEQLAPDAAAIERCSWYRQEPQTEGPTRRQRALYAGRGGLSDRFIRDELDLDPKEMFREFGPAFQELNKHTHLRPDTVITDPVEVEEFANAGLQALCDIFDVAEDIRSQLVGRMEGHLHDEAMDTFINETIDSLDLLGGRCETGIVWCEEMKVVRIDDSTIHYEISGSVDVTLHWGNGPDAAEMQETFPFVMKTAAPVDRPFELQSDLTEVEVDTGSWYGDEEEGGVAEQPQA